VYTTRQGQAWDEIAREVYGKEIHADYLMQCNPRLLDIFVFPAGIRAETPELPKARDGIPPWR